MDKDDAAAVASRKEADTKKSALIDSYSASASALLDLIGLNKQISETEKTEKTEKTANTENTENTEGEKGEKGEQGEKGEKEAEVISLLQAVKIDQPTPPSLISSPSPTAPPTPSSEEVALKTLNEHQNIVKNKKDFELHYKLLQKWDDVTSERHWVLFLGRLRGKNQWGLALKKVAELGAAAADNKLKGETVSREVLYEVSGE